MPRASIVITLSGDGASLALRGNSPLCQQKRAPCRHASFPSPRRTQKPRRRECHSESQSPPNCQAYSQSCRYV